MGRKGGSGPFSRAEGIVVERDALADSMASVAFELDDFTIHRGRVCEKGLEVVWEFWKAGALS
jgi:hypothetical protein